MSLERNISLSDAWFAGTTRRLLFEILHAGADPASAIAPPADVTGRTFRFALMTAVGLTPHRLRGPVVVEKVTGAGVVVQGAYHADRARNTQRVVVTLDDADTADLTGGPYVYALALADTADVVAYGTVPLLVAAVP